MAFVSILRQCVLPVLLSTALVIVFDRWPYSARRRRQWHTVGSISAPERRAPPARMQMAPSEQAYPAANAPLSDAAGSVDYLNTPNLAGTGQRRAQSQSQTLQAPAQAGRLPMIDSDEAMAGAQGAAVSLRNQPSTWGGTQQLAVPAGGVNVTLNLEPSPSSVLPRSNSNRSPRASRISPLSMASVPTIPPSSTAGASRAGRAGADGQRACVDRWKAGGRAGARAGRERGTAGRHAATQQPDRADDE